MAVDINKWREVFIETVEGIADQAYQERAWLGVGPEQSSPGEDVIQFFSNAAAKDFLARSDTGLNEIQLAAATRLFNLLKNLLSEIPKGIDCSIAPAEFIHDPRWIPCRKAAQDFMGLLESPPMQN